MRSTSLLSSFASAALVLGTSAYASDMLKGLHPCPPEAIRRATADGEDRRCTGCHYAPTTRASGRLRITPAPVEFGDLRR